ncbi:MULTISPECIES: PQQ-binding-like beta-propeller repeat protein [Natrialbaceae]|uniref:PQQ-binding-like beta-propeller repeat protein n=1 Tax=Natrialbaceae TaxID=1644061 RepID=UPI00207C9EB8|nr:PQQ-binding-like beta-propeller repeat protein [Natronococcus sp. CG52]
MAMWDRRSVLATCAALSTTGALASIGSTAAESTGSGETTSSSGWLDGSEGWSSARGNAANSRYLPLEGEFPKPDTEAWRYELPDAEDVETAVTTDRVAVVDGTVYVRTDGEIHALDAAHGDLEWATDADATGAPAVFDGAVYVTGDRHLAALDTADGTVEWEREFETDESLADPTIAFETIYLVVDGALHALEPADGSTQWTVETVDVRANSPDSESDERVPTPFRPETVAVANGTVYAALEGAPWVDESAWEDETFEFSCAFGAVDAATGDREWGVALVDPYAGGDTAAPITASERVVNANLTSGTGSYRLSTEDGSGYFLEWSVKAGTETRFVHTYGDMNGLLSVRDHEDENHWMVESDVTAWQSPIVVGDTLIADHYSTYTSDYPKKSLVAFDIADGSDRWVLDFDEQLSDSSGEPAAAAENTLYLETGEALVALRSSDAEPDDGDDSDDGDGDDDSDCDCEDGNGGGDGNGNNDGDGGNGDSDDSDADGGNGGSDGDDENGDIGDGDGSNGGDDDTGSDGDATEPDEDDSVPGFTTGAGLLGGAATLEWLRRKAGADESTAVDESAK